MTDVWVALALIVGAAIGATIESRRHVCSNDKRARIAANGLIRWRNDALRWKAEAEGHAIVLRALGRVVAEGGTVTGPDQRHPSMRKDGGRDAR